MFWKVLRHVFVPSSGFDENSIKGAFYLGAPLAPLYPTLRNLYFIIFLPKLSLNGRALISEFERMSDIHVLTAIRTAAFEAVSASQYIFIFYFYFGRKHRETFQMFGKMFGACCLFKCTLYVTQTHGSCMVGVCVEQHWLKTMKRSQFCSISNFLKFIALLNVLVSDSL